MYKNTILSIAFCLVTTMSFAQSSPAVTKALRDPKRAEKEAKTDVYIQQKHRITDSASVGTLPSTKPAKKRNHKRKTS